MQTALVGASDVSNQTSKKHKNLRVDKSIELYDIFKLINLSKAFIL